jgi:hypothetical protein
VKIGKIIILLPYLGYIIVVRKKSPKIDYNNSIENIITSSTDLLMVIIGGVKI